MNIYQEILMRNTKEKCINEMNIYVIKMLYFNEVRKAKERKKSGFVFYSKIFILLGFFTYLIY